MNYLQNKVVEFRDLGSISYHIARETQLDLLNSIVQTKLANRKRAESDFETTNNYLLFCEHSHVYTLGKNGDKHNVLLNPEELEKKGIEYYHIERGGDITYHGPGQIVGYPIFDLENFFTDLHKYLRAIEDIIISTLAHFEIKAGIYPGLTGVWIDPETDNARKIAAIGIKCSRWVTMHGFAFNINTDLDYFNYIIPCGIKDKQVTSLEKELGHEIDLGVVRELLKNEFKHRFSLVYK